MKCSHCRGPIAQIPDKFSGKYYVTPSGGQVHDECWSAFNDEIASERPACAHCKLEIAVVKGRFSGKFFEMAGDKKIHAECRKWVGPE